MPPLQNPFVRRKETGLWGGRPLDRAERLPIEREAEARDGARLVAEPQERGHRADGLGLRVHAVVSVREEERRARTACGHLAGVEGEREAVAAFGERLKRPVRACEQRAAIAAVLESTV